MAKNAPTETLAPQGVAEHEGARPISSDEFASRLGQLCVRSRLTGVAKRYRDQHILLKSVVLTLGVAESYSEPHMNDRLIFWLTDIAPSLDLDHAFLRRWLVSEGYLERDSHGRSYRIGSSGGTKGLFEPGVEDIDVYEAIGIAIKEVQEKKRQYLKSPPASKRNKLP